ncbi:MAG: hypothetical protein HZA84_04120 [Thaumarchaeota archaeon]|nr:hypothetical protein [Nitrososphaerota archaeon]
MLPILEKPEKKSHFSDNVVSVNGNFQPDPKVLVRIANAFYEKSYLKITQIHFFSRTTWPSLKKYLDWLEKDGYLQYDKGDKSYYPTETGWRLFRQISLLYDRIDFKKGKPLALI